MLFEFPDADLTREIEASIKGVNVIRAALQAPPTISHWKTQIPQHDTLHDSFTKTDFPFCV